MGEQNRGRGGQPILVENALQGAKSTLAWVDDDGVGPPGAWGQHVAIACQHAGRKPGEQHVVQFPIP